MILLINIIKYSYFSYPQGLDYISRESNTFNAELFQFDVLFVCLSIHLKKYYNNVLIFIRTSTWIVHKSIYIVVITVNSN